LPFRFLNGDADFSALSDPWGLKIVLGITGTTKGRERDMRGMGGHEGGGTAISKFRSP